MESKGLVVGVENREKREEWKPRQYKDLFLQNPKVKGF